MTEPTYPSILFALADCPSCHQRWAIMRNPLQPDTCGYYDAHQKDFSKPEYLVAGNGFMCPIATCQTPLIKCHIAAISESGDWLKLRVPQS